VLNGDTVLGPVSTSSGEQGDQNEESDEEEDEDNEGSETSVDPSIQLINSNPLRTDSLIDEPITSGNDSPDGPN